MPNGYVSRSAPLSVNGSRRTSASVLMSRGRTPRSSSCSTVVGHALVDPRDGRLQPSQLKRAQLSALHALVLRVPDHVRVPLRLPGTEVDRAHRLVCEEVVRRCPGARSCRSASRSRGPSASARASRPARPTASSLRRPAASREPRRSRRSPSAPGPGTARRAAGAAVPTSARAPRPASAARPRKACSADCSARSREHREQLVHPREPFLGDCLRARLASRRRRARGCRATDNGPNSSLPSGTNATPCATSCSGRWPVTGATVEMHRPGRRRHQPDNRLEQRGLPRAVRADEGDDLAHIHVKVDTPEHIGATVARVEPLDREQLAFTHRRPPPRPGTRR